MIVLLFVTKSSEYIEPKCFEDVFKKTWWKDTIKEEIDALHKNYTWELMPRTIGKKLLGCKWVYKSKLNSDGSLNRYKA